MGFLAKSLRRKAFCFKLKKKILLTINESTNCQISRKSKSILNLKPETKNLPLKFRFVPNVKYHATNNKRYAQ